MAKPALRWAVLAFGCATAGEWALTVGLAVVAYEDGGAAAVGAVAALRLFPSALGTPLLMSVAERVHRRHALVAVSGVRTMSLGGAAMLLGFDAPRLWFYVAVILATIVATVFRPAHSSLLPLLCTTHVELAGANATRGLLESVASLAGPLLAGAVLAWSGPSGVLITAAGASLLAALLLARVPLDDAVPTPRSPGGRTRVLSNVLQGMAVVAGQCDLRWIFGLALAQTYTRGALNVFMAVMAFEVFDAGGTGVAALTAALGVGAVIGAVGAATLAGSGHLGSWLALAMVGWGAPIAVIGGLAWLPVGALTVAEPLAYGLVALVGGANAVVDVPLFTLPVRLVDNAVLGSVFALFESVVTIGVTAGSALTPLLLRVAGIEAAMIGTGLLLPVGAALAWRSLRALDERLGVADGDIAVLHHTALLSLLSVPGTELLARRVRRRVIAAGAYLFHQGEPAGSFYVIVDGRADVIGDGAEVATMVPGDCFGEIALLRDIPRTASVRAHDELMVLEIDREVFVEVVSGHRPTTSAANALIDSHLAHFPSRVHP